MLDPSLLDALAALDTPTICNALEVHNSSRDVLRIFVAYLWHAFYGWLFVSHREGSKPVATQYKR